MRSFMIKYGVLKLLMIFIVVCLSRPAAVAQTGTDVVDISTEVSEEKTDLADLEQRMQKRIFIDHNDTSIDLVIRQLAEQADLNIIKSPKVIGNVTVTFTDVPLEEALNNILAVHNCTYILTDNIIRVITSAEKVEEVEPLKTKTFEIVYADVKPVVDALDKFKSSRGSVSSIDGTSYIIITDTESKIREIAALLEKIDRITPQILVEARIYDITSKDRLDLGVEWQAGRNTTYDATGGITGVGIDPDSGIDNPFFTGLFEGATSKTSSTSGALRFGWLGPNIDIDAVLRAQHENINAKLLANPRILVLDNQTANIKIISQLPYQELTESAAGGSIGTTAFKDVGVELVVTPHLASRDEMIRLNLRPKFSVKVGDVTFESGVLKYPQPIIDTREAETTLLIKNGQTVVLGGLRKKEVNQQINKIPLLGDIPLFGALFRFEGEDTVTSELVVFITPWIVEQPVLSEDEEQALEETMFSGPKPISTKAEKKANESELK